VHAYSRPKKDTHVCDVGLVVQRWVFLWTDLQMFFLQFANFEHIFPLC